MNRRRFLATAGVAAVSPIARAAQGPQTPSGKARFRTGLVAYSYRQALQAKTMTYEDLIRIAVETGTDGIDMTVYWLPGTSDDYLLPFVASHTKIASRSTASEHACGSRSQPLNCRNNNWTTCANGWTSRRRSGRPMCACSAARSRPGPLWIKPSGLQPRR